MIARRDVPVAVTHEVEIDDLLVAALESAGVTPLDWSAVRTVPGDVDAVRRALAPDRAIDWMVVTSRRGVEAIRAITDRLPDSIRVATVGPRTAAAAEAAGWQVSLASPGPGAAALADSLVSQLEPGARILFPASSQASLVLEERLRDAGASVHRVTAYRTEPREVDSGRFRAALEAGPMGAVTFLSPSAARGLTDSVDREGLGAVLRSSPAIAIGPETARALGALGFGEVRTSPTTSKRAVADCVLDALGPARTRTP